MTTSLADWTPRQRPGTNILHGQRVRLEPLAWGRHRDGLFAAVAGEHNGDLWQYMPIGPFAQCESFQQMLDHARARQGWETLVIVDTQSNQVLGMASYMRIREEHGSAEIGCVAFGDNLKRTPQATEALLLMAAHVFDLGYRRYEWKCNNANLASKRCAERFGFHFEGIFRNDMVTKGANRDTAWYSIIDSEWLVLRRALEAWLARENFDRDDRQLRQLENFRA